MRQIFFVGEMIIINFRENKMSKILKLNPFYSEKIWGYEEWNLSTHRNGNSIISGSDVKLIDELKNEKKNFTYSFLSPIFDSISKSSYTAAFDMEVLKQSAEAGVIDKKVMALGGITTENVDVIKDLGFGGVVVLGDLWNRFHIHSTLDYKELINHFRKLRKVTD